MSNIDLKALRDAEQGSLNGGRAGVVVDTFDVIELLDRLESAERRAEDAEKERDAQKDIAHQLARYMGMVVAACGWPRDFPVIDLLPQIEVLRKDANRYQWLLKNAAEFTNCVTDATGVRCESDADADDAIDEAIAQERE